MKLSRRDVLRGAGGVTIALPFLEARAQTVTKKRFVALYHPNGVFTPQWFPTPGLTENDFSLGPIHAALEPWKSRCLFTGGLDMKVALTGAGEQHQRGVGAFLTGAKLDAGSFVGNDGSTAGFAMGPSIDQTLVPLIGQGTLVPSLQLGVHALLPNVAGCVSYAGPNQPLLPQNDPRLTFRTLFGDSSLPPDEAAVLRRKRRSVLDAVVSQLSSLKQSVSTSDRARLDEHLTMVRSLETRLTSMPAGTCAAPTDPGAVAWQQEAQFGTVAQLQLDLLALALRCDLTRVATVMFSDALNHTTLPHLDITTDVHNLTHLSDEDPSRLQVAKRDTWQSGVLANLLSALDALDDGNGATVLDNTLVFWGTDVSRGNTHAHDDMPFVLAGGGAGFRMGRYARWNGVNHNDLLTSIANAFGAGVASYGTPEFCTGELTNLY